MTSWSTRAEFAGVQQRVEIGACYCGRREKGLDQVTEPGAIDAVVAERAEEEGRPLRDGIRLDVDGLTQRLQCRFQHSLAQGRVGEDRAGDVLEPRAHLDGKAKRRRQLGDPCADALNTE